MNTNVEDKINTLLTRDPNKEKVYTEGYDGHSLRAYYYWGEQMPDIQQAKDDELCIKLNGEYLKSDDVIHYKGKSYTVKEFYETFR